MKKPLKLLSILLTACILAAVIGVCLTAVSAQAGKHTITFDVQGIGETPDPITVNDGDCFLYLRENGANNPTADGYVFHCWVTTLDFYPDEVEMSNTAAYLETPIHEDMTLYAVWYKIIDHIEIEADPPIAGDVIGTKWYGSDDEYLFQYQSPRPTVRTLSEGVCINDSFWSDIGPAAFWLEDPNDWESTFKGTFELGKEYGVFAETAPLFGYQFADKVAVTFNGKLLDAEREADDNLCIVSAPIICENQPETARLLGDIDGDGDVMITDAAFLQRKIAGIDLPFTFSGAAADTDGDRQITLMDVTFLQRWLADMDSSSQIGKPI